VRRGPGADTGAFRLLSVMIGGGAACVLRKTAGKSTGYFSRGISLRGNAERSFSICLDWWAETTKATLSDRLRNGQTCGQDLARRPPCEDGRERVRDEDAGHGHRSPRQTRIKNAASKRKGELRRK
jgi:hypothetical protein